MVPPREVERTDGASRYSPFYGRNGFEDRFSRVRYHVARPKIPIFASHTAGSREVEETGQDLRKGRSGLHPTLAIDSLCPGNRRKLWPLTNH